MSGMFWIALQLSIPKVGLNVKLSLTVKKLDAFKFDGVAESDNSASKTTGTLSEDDMYLHEIDNPQKLFYFEGKKEINRIFYVAAFYLP